MLTSSAPLGRTVDASEPPNFRDTAQRAAGSDASGPGRRTSRPPSFLVVEDYWHIANAIRMALKEAGLTEVATVGSLQKADMLLDKGYPDVAIVDLNIKGQSSVTLIERLVRAEVKVIVISGYANLENLNVPVAATMKKPVTAETLLGAVRKLIGHA
ncbi:MAG: response regulator [Hyphomicrobiaceae bacterium]